jgi:hypothetical protein
MKLIFLASEAQYEPHLDTGVPPISSSQPCEIEIVCPDFFQITYGCLRVGPDGDNVAYHDDDFWQTAADLRVMRAEMLDGRQLDPATIQTRNMLFTDVIVSP